jgi:hypothetical protein
MKKDIVCTVKSISLALKDGKFSYLSNSFEGTMGSVLRQLSSRKHLRIYAAQDSIATGMSNAVGLFIRT